MIATVARTPGRVVHPPEMAVPRGACDTHLHIFGDPDAFPVRPGTTELPAAGTLDLWLERLRAHLDGLGLTRGVIVQSVVYGEDNRLTAEAIAGMGEDRLRGVALVASDISANALRRLHGQGFRGVRLNLSFRGALDLDGLEALAPRLADLGWHALVNLPRYVGLPLDVLVPRLIELPVPVVLDHYGYPADGDDDAQMRLLEADNGWIKLSAGYRQTGIDPEAAMRRFAGARPERLLWASDWPHVRWTGPMPDNAVQLDTLGRAVPDPALRRTILTDNPARLYDFAGPTLPTRRDPRDALSRG